MARIKYYYNTETCNYERVDISKWDIFFDLLGFLTISFVIAIGISWSYNACFDSPKELALKQENTLLKQHYNELQQAVEQSNQVLAHLKKQDSTLYRMLLEVEPPRASFKQERTSNTSSYQALMRQSELLGSTTQKVDQLKRQLYEQSMSYEEITKIAENRSEMLACMPAIPPLKFFRISSPFGERIHPIFHRRHHHSGTDMAAPRGTPIYASGNGVVKMARTAGGYGNCVYIAHGHGYISKYAHMQSFIVKPGQKVKRGECIGYVGATGTATAPHLHYEVHKNRRTVNPVNYFVGDLDPNEYDMIVKLATQKIPASQ